MKKLFVLLVIALSAIGASGQGVQEWNFSTWNTGDYTEEITKDGLTLYATSGKKITVDGNTKTVDGIKYTQRLKFGGTGSWDGDTPVGRVLSFAVSGNCDIYIVLAHSSKSGDARDLKIDAVIEGNKTNIGSISVNANEIKSGTVVYNQTKPATIYIYSGNSGINLYDIKVTPSITATVGTAGYATFCTTATCKVPSGLTAYTAAYNATSGKVDLTEVADGIIPANNGVILKGEAKEYTMETATSEVKSLDGNKLKGVTADYTLTDKDYILVNDGGVVKFGKATVGTTLAAGKVYLPIENPNAAKIINMDFDGTTGINAVETASDKDDAYYTLSGVKTLKPTKGMLYIHNGKKYIAK
ncbi:hypothetical protein [Prevotella sp.]|uniref:hypothetical protein n=1 Tax=Prevotella sp. TaxID=59823 RepID=UPI00307C4741